MSGTEFISVKVRLEPLLQELWHRLFVFFSCAIVILLAPVLIPFYAVCCAMVLIVRLKLAWSGAANRAHVASGMDTLWSSGDPEESYIVNGVLFLDGEGEVQTFRDRLEALILSDSDDNSCNYPFRKLRQKLTEEMGVCVWRDCENFSIDDHVLLESPQANEEALRTAVENLSVQVFDKDYPPWLVHVIPLDPVTYPGPDGEAQFCLVFRIDHVIADGISIIYLLLKHVMDPSETNSAFLNPPRPRPVNSHIHVIWRILDAIIQAPSIVISLITRAEQNSLHGAKPTKNKYIRWSRPIPLQTFREIRQATGATVNDIYLSALTGTLRRHFITLDRIFPQQVTAIIPVSLHASANSITRLENNLTVGLLPLAANVSDPRARLAAISRATQAFKRSAELIVNMWVFRYLINTVPLCITRRIFSATPATLISSTVPGPPHPISICGHRLRKVIYFSPHRGTTTITACLMSYAQQLNLVLYVDAALVASSKDVDRLVAGFNDEIEKLYVNCVQPSSTNK